MYSVLVQILDAAKSRDWTLLAKRGDLRDEYSAFLDSLWEPLKNTLAVGATTLLQNKEKLDGHLTTRNGNALFALACACVALVSMSQAVDSPKDSKTKVIAVLIARAIQISQEILTLLISGFTDGALGRWRSLYELYAVLCVVSRGNESLAERFLDYSTYQKIQTTRATSEKELSEIDKAQLDDLLSSLQSRYPKSFFRPLGWIDPDLGAPARQRSFFSLVREYGMEPFITFYQLASENIHSSPSSVMFPLGSVELEGQMQVPAGPGWGSMELPVELTIRACSHICIELTPCDSESDRLAVYNLFLRISDELCGFFLY